MERTKTEEVAAIEQMLAEVLEAQTKELNDLQLAFAGGGSADTIFC